MPYTSDRTGGGYFSGGGSDWEERAGPPGRSRGMPRRRGGRGGGPPFNNSRFSAGPAQRGTGEEPMPDSDKGYYTDSCLATSNGRGRGGRGGRGGGGPGRRRGGGGGGMPNEANGELVSSVSLATSCLTSLCILRHVWIKCGTTSLLHRYFIYIVTPRINYCC